MAAYDAWRFEVSSADPDAAVPVWVNLTSRVRTTGSGQRAVQIRRGAGSERDDVQPSTLTAQLENTDHALTPGNPTSPYVSWWGQRRKCRLVETVLGVDYIRFTGYTNPLDLTDWAAPGVEQFVNLTAVDWLGRLDTAPAFTGTLQEHIRTTGGPLALHYPLSDPSLPMLSANTLSRLALSITTVGAFPPVPTADPGELLQPAGQPGPPGDDQSYPRWLQSMSEDGTTFNGNLSLVSKGLGLQVTSGQSIAVTFWAYLQSHTVNPGITPPNSVALWLTSTDRAHQILVGGFGSQDIWQAGAQAAGGPMVDALAGRSLERDAWRLVTARFTLPSGLIELWVGTDVQASAVVASPPASVSFDEVQIGYLLWKGSLAQVQVRVGPTASTMSYADHVAQHLHGYRGLHRQTAAERVTTLAGYAGVPASDLAVDAAAATPMQAARLARVRPASGMRAAATTESGRLFVTGDGKIRLRARAARYNQPTALQIPYGWLLRGLRFREDTPINDATASQAGSYTRRSDPASITRYGVGSDSVTLESAIDADPGNWAAWTVATYATPRLRCPQLVIDLLPLTAAQRAQLLALEIGQRIEVTGGPSTIPPAARHLIIEGFAPDEIGVETRRITLNTSPLLGPSAGTPPRSVMVGDLASTTAVISY
ncbi:hypothetical protein [Micromonospora fulviviridis]|uniref:hypothetical protein n=1 Tax=Micromonospora fulviviridis TaxID=47860 RepID=UPI0037AF1A96